MVDAAQLVSESEKSFRVHPRAYIDQSVFEMEMDRIFGMTWIYVAHESELKKPGDFKTAYIGSQPVIVSRDESGGVNVLFNRCRHRGAAVCREQSGNARQFRCFYHGWIYNLRGDLIGLAQRSGYPDNFPQKQMGLVSVARIEVYRGLIFASLNPNVCSLEEHLGQAKDVLDTILSVSPEGIDLQHGYTKHAYDANWKFQCENTVDGYHGNYVHASFQETSSRSRDTSILRQVRGGGDTSVIEQQAFRDLGQTRGFLNGHGTLDRPMTEARLRELIQIDSSGFYAGVLERLGMERALDALAQHNLYIFPNLFFAFGPILRVVQPISADRTEVYQYPYYLRSADAQFNSMHLRQVEQFQGPAGFGTPDDVEVFDSCQTGMHADHAQWIDLSRGKYRETIENGITFGHSTDEVPQRALYRKWQSLLSTEAH